MALSLGAEGIEYLDKGQFQSFLSYRWLTADTGYVGAKKDQHYRRDVGADITVQSIDWNLTYGLTKRFSLSGTLPMIYAKGRSRREHGLADSNPTPVEPGGNRHTTTGSGIGDLRITANAWLWDPDVSPKGNASLSLGFKAPTGDAAQTDTYHRGGTTLRAPLDIALWPGDGGWGLVMEMQAFRNVLERTYLYATGFYLANPKDEVTTDTQVNVYGVPRNVSVPDQYQGRLGVSYLLWPHQSLAVSLGARIDGITRKDLIGGNDGFRRPGFSVYVEPGLTLSRGKTTFSLYVPVLAVANRERNGLDEWATSGPPGESFCDTHQVSNCGHGPGAFADYLIIFSVSRRF
jgi:hypothetical protein